MDWEMYDPCPNCGAQSEETFRQVIRQTEQVQIDENGEPTYFEPVNGSYEVVAIACTDCDTVILGDEDEFTDSHKGLM